MHDVAAVGLEVAGGGLFDVLDAFEAFGGFGLYLAEEFEEVIDVGAAFVEVDAVAPVDVGTGFIGDSVYGDDAFDVPLEFVALELDFDVVEAVELDPLREGFGEAVADGFDDVGGGEGVGAADGVVEIDGLAGLFEDVFVEAFVGEVFAEEGVEGGAEEIGAVSVVAVAVVDFAEGVVDGGVEGAGGDDGAEFGDDGVDFVGGL